jgi:cytochrome c-type biogenesis protein CcmH/NrfG
MTRPSYLKAVLPLLLVFTIASTGRAADAADKERAVSALEQDIKTDPNNPELWLHLGYAYRKTGQLGQAQKAFEKTAAMDPRNRDALYMLGLIYEKKNQPQDALRIWNAYLSAETDPAKREIAQKHIHHLNQE